MKAGPVYRDTNGQQAFSGQTNGRSEIMPFIMKNVVPWGRTLDEYRKMFSLSDAELEGHIACFGDGVASFNAECDMQGGHVTSFDPVYRFSCDRLELVLEEAKRRLIEKTCHEGHGNDRSGVERDINELQKRHMTAVEIFMDDFEEGKKQGRYIDYELPYRIPCPDNRFDLGLSSHFLLSSARPGINFHYQALEEMLRICHEVRIFPIVDMHGRETDLARKVIRRFAGSHDLWICKTAYHCAGNHNDMLVIRNVFKPSASLLH